ncbi:MAG: hypothetical protein R2857_15830 [Vampirovibrionales bacterium]
MIKPILGILQHVRAFLAGAMFSSAMFSGAVVPVKALALHHHRRR